MTEIHFFTLLAVSLLLLSLTFASGGRDGRKGCKARACLVFSVCYSYRLVFPIQLGGQIVAKPFWTARRDGCWLLAAVAGAIEVTSPEHSIKSQPHLGPCQSHSPALSSLLGGEKQRMYVRQQLLSSRVLYA